MVRGLVALVAIAGVVFGADGALAQTKTGLTAAEIEAALSAAGLAPEMTEDASTGAPVAAGRAGEFQFWVRALDCEGGSCSTLMFFANFNLNRPVTPDDYRVLNRFNDGQVFGRAYVLEAQNEIGVDFVIELDGGVSMQNVSNNIARWADVITAFVDNFRKGPASS